jgi:hypothetical protein
LVVDEEQKGSKRRENMSSENIVVGRARSLGTPNIFG